MPPSQRAYRRIAIVCGPKLREQKKTRREIRRVVPHPLGKSLPEQLRVQLIPNVGYGRAPSFVKEVLDGRALIRPLCSQKSEKSPYISFTTSTWGLSRTGHYHDPFSCPLRRYSRKTPPAVTSGGGLANGVPFPRRFTHFSHKLPFLGCPVHFGTSPPVSGNKLHSRRNLRHDCR